MGYEYNFCRGFGHSWHHDPITPVEGGFELFRRCTQCGMERTTLINRRGGYIKSHRYHAPDGYRVKGGMEHLTARKNFIREEG